MSHAQFPWVDYEGLSACRARAASSSRLATPSFETLCSSCAWLSLSPSFDASATDSSACTRAARHACKGLTSAMGTPACGRTRSWPCIRSSPPCAAPPRSCRAPAAALGRTRCGCSAGPGAEGSGLATSRATQRARQPQAYHRQPEQAGCAAGASMAGAAEARDGGWSPGPALTPRSRRRRWSGHPLASVTLPSRSNAVRGAGRAGGCTAGPREHLASGARKQRKARGAGFGALRYQIPNLAQAEGGGRWARPCPALG